MAAVAAVPDSSSLSLQWKKQEKIYVPYLDKHERRERMNGFCL
jgi:hypothetical protein